MFQYMYHYLLIVDIYIIWTTLYIAPVFWLFIFSSVHCLHVSCLCFAAGGLGGGGLGGMAPTPPATSSATITDTNATNSLVASLTAAAVAASTTG